MRRIIKIHDTLIRPPYSYLQVTPMATVYVIFLKETKKRKEFTIDENISFAEG